MEIPEWLLPTLDATVEALRPFIAGRMNRTANKVESDIPEFDPDA